MAKRGTAASLERMRLISQLARKDKRDDDFGRRDEDWDVYKAINKVCSFYNYYYLYFLLLEIITSNPSFYYQNNIFSNLRVFNGSL